MISLAPEHTLAPALSWFVGYGIGGFVLLGLLAIACLSWRLYARDARRANSAYDPTSQLPEGPAVIAGKVQYLADSDKAVRIEIEQEGTEHSEGSGEWLHRWTEIDRRVHVAPFYLQRVQGERVRIHATERVSLIDEMDGCIQVNQLKRVRVAELVPGEEVIARGVLRRDLDPEAPSDGSAEAPVSWILEPPRHGPMHLSSEALGDRFARWRRFYRRAAVLLLLTFVGAQVVLLSYHARIFGSSGTAYVTAKDHYITVDDDDDDETDHWQVSSKTRSGESYVENVDYKGWRRLGAGSEVSIRHFDRGWIQYGSRPTLFLVSALLVLGIAIAIAAVVVYFVAIHRAKPWYAVKVVNKASGLLDEDTGLGKYL